jgi:hypothetical protein
MRKFAALLPLLVQTMFLFGQTVNDDQSFADFTYDQSIIARNKVKSVTREMSFSNGKRSIKSTYHFDKNGLLTKQSITGTDGKLKQVFLYVTNAHKHLLYTIQKDYEHKRVDTVTYFKSYAHDKLVKDSSSQMPISHHYEYDSNGHLFKTVIIFNYGPGNIMKKVIIHKYDRLQRISNSTETVFKNEADTVGSIFSDRDYFYNTKGQIKSEIDKLNSTYTWMGYKGTVNYFYDQKGNVTQVVRKNAASYYYTYNHKGLVIKKRMIVKFDGDDLTDAEPTLGTFDTFRYTYR